MLRRLLLLLCFSTTFSATAAEPIVVLVSLDGFRADYLDRRRTPTLSRIARDGVRATSMRPAFPALTFPNHYTIATGLDPDRHGIVHNTMVDPALGRFTIHDKRAVQTGGWWGGEPIWVTARKHGLRTASMFWVGSEAPVQGIRPDEWFPFEAKVKYDARVTQVLDWLARPDETRPHLVMLYFEIMDDVGHAHSPDDATVDRALTEVDRLMARLLLGVRELGLADRVNLVVVSDHGMQPSPPKRVLKLDDFVDIESVDVVSTGQVLALSPKRGRQAEVERALLGRRKHFECWRKGELPKRFRYGTHPRIPAIVCLMDAGFNVATRAEAEARGRPFNSGSHGYDPDHESMAALFIAKGPRVKRGEVLARIESRDVYNVVAALLGVTPAPNDGDATVVPRVVRGEKTSGR